MPQNFAQVYKKIAKAWKKRRVLRNANLKLRQQLGSANDWPKQHRAKLLPNQESFWLSDKASNAELNPAATSNSL